MADAPVQHAIKRGIDVSVSAVLLVLLAPVMAGAALAILATSGPPVLFRQVRPGLHGAPFVVYKFRTMRRGDGDDDARLTKLGRWMRSLSVDELPQLWNVIRGEMSLVGPRPLLMEYLEHYTPQQARRHDVRPGITGLAQIAGRNALLWERQLALDVEYVDNWSISLDLSILARSIVKVARRSGISQEGRATRERFDRRDGGDGDSRPV